MKRKLHIVGCPRSGTTLLMEMLCTCFRSAAFCEHEVDIFEAPDPLDGVAFSKKPSDIRYLRRVFEADPGLHVIYMVRDPRSVIVSRHGARPDLYWVDYEDWKVCQAAAVPLREHPRFLEVRYEDLVADPDAVQRRIEKRFPWLERLHAFSEYHRFSRASEASALAMHGVRPVSADRVRSWERHLPRLQAQLQRYPEMVADLIEAGYETDGAWTVQLQGVEPLVAPRNRKRAYLGLRRLETRFRKWLLTRRYLARLRASPAAPP